MYREQINVIALTWSNTVRSALLVYSDIYLWLRVTSDQAPDFLLALNMFTGWNDNQISPDRSFYSTCKRVHLGVQDDV